MAASNKQVRRSRSPHRDIFPLVPDRHQATRRLVQLCQSADLVVELTLLLTNVLTDQEQRRYHAEKQMINAQKFTDLVAELLAYRARE